MDDDDNMYLENIDEFVNDENKIVSYKWLSRTLSVHVNQSKQMLYSYVQLQRNKKDNDSIHVLYLVAGLSRPEVDKEQRHRVIVAAEENLESVKRSLSVLTSCHIYSVQKTHVKDSSVLVQADYDLGKAQNFTHLSAIKCPSAVPRITPEIHVAESTQIENKTSRDELHSGKTNSSVKSSKPSGLKAMFAAGAQKTQDKTKKESTAATNQKTQDTNKESPAISHKKEESKASKPQNSTKPGNVMSFFSNHATKPKEQKTASVKQETEKVKEKSRSQKEKTPVKESRKKKANISSDEGESPVPQQKKRRRIRTATVESSSDEEEASDEEMNVEVENPIPSPPASPPSPPPSPTPDLADSQNIPATKAANGSVVQAKNGRRRRRKLVPKTSIDEDGFMVTEKVWESESTDASEDETSNNNTNPQKEPPKPEPKTKVVEKKASPVKGKPKQASLMSFFKKK